MYCVRIPTVNNKPSELFQDLIKEYKDRTLVKSLYGLFTSKAFLDNYGKELTFDSNDEPTIESVLHFVSLTHSTNDVAKIADYEKQLNNNEYNSVLDALDKVVDFNKTHTNCVAKINEFGDNIKITVSTTDNNTSAEKTQLENALKIHNKIAKIMDRFNLPIHILDANLFNQEAGLMNPKALEATGNGLWGVVNIANNLSGVKVLSEEFSHFLVEILSLENNPIIARTEKLLEDNLQIVENILGDDYANVVKYYSEKGREDLIVREALGRIVSQIVNEKITSSDNMLIDRSANAVLNYIKRTFKVNNSTVLDELSDLMQDLSEVVSEFMEREEIEKSTIQRFKQYANTLAHVTNLIGTVSENINTSTNELTKRVMKYLSVYEHNLDRKSRKSYETLLKNLLKQLNTTQLDDKETIFIETVTNIANFVTTTLQKEMRSLENISISTIPHKDLYKYARPLNTIKTIIDCYREPMIDIMYVLKEMYSDWVKNGSGGNSGRKDDSKIPQIRILYNEVFPDLLDLFTKTEMEFFATNKKLLLAFAKPYFNDGTGELKVEFGKKLGIDKDKVITLANVLDFSMGDISFVNRMLQSATNTDDLFLQLIDHIFANREEKIRAEQVDWYHKIQQEDKILRDSGIKNTKFIYELDDDGKITGNLVSDRKIWLWDRERKAYKDKLENDKSLSEADVINKMAIWDGQYSKYEETRPGYFNLMPNPKIERYRNTNFQNGWTQAQKNYYDAYLNIKESLDRLVPATQRHLYRAVQMMVSSTGEAILNSSTGFMGGIKGAVGSVFDNYFRITELDNGEYYNGTADTIKKYLKKLSNVISGKTNEIDETSTTLTFDKKVYNRVPTYFLNELEDMSKLSTDATHALVEYMLMATHYNGMHEIVDIMELFRVQNEIRTIKRTNSLGERVKEKIKKTLNGTTIEVETDSPLPTQETNLYKRVNELIDMRLYSKNKLQGKTIAGSFTSGKLADDLISLTAFSVLGYSMFSGINNVVVAKYQMLIESMGGEFFSFKDWMSAEKDFLKLAPEMLSELHLPYRTSFGGLLSEFFNVGLNWKNSIKENKHYKGSIQQLLSQFGPNFLLESGEFSIQMMTLIAFLKNYKLYESNPKLATDKSTIKSISLFDALEKQNIEQDGKKVDAKLQLKEKYANWFTENGEVFDFQLGSKQIKNIVFLVGKINQDMHGIYNNEDRNILSRYGIGRMLQLFRKPIISQFQKRYKGIGKFEPIYNYRTGQFEEGFMVTLIRMLHDFIVPMDDDLRKDLEAKFDTSSKWALLKHSLTKHQQANLKKAYAEIGSLIAIFVLCVVLTNLDWDDEDDVAAKRKVYYFVRRCQAEAVSSYSPMTLMDIMISPSATISQLERYSQVVNTLGNNDILKSGPYKGHTKRYAAFMRALPVYPQVKDWLFIDTDNRRFEVFKNKSRLLESIFTE